MDILDRIEKKLFDLPTELEKNALGKATKNIEKISRIASNYESHLEKDLKYLESHLHDYEKAVNEGKLKLFDGQLQTFFENIMVMYENMSKTLLDLEINQNTSNEINSLIENLPNLLKYVLFKGLKQLDNNSSNIPWWLTKSKKIKNLSSNFLNENELKSLIKNNPSKVQEIKQALKTLKFEIALFTPTLELIKSLCPEDLSLNVDVLGEGGGTELSGHPVKIPFNFITWTTSMADIACDRLLDSISEASEN